MSECPTLSDVIIVYGKLFTEKWTIKIHVSKLDLMYQCGDGFMIDFGFEKHLPTVLIWPLISFHGILQT